MFSLFRNKSSLYVASIHANTSTGSARFQAMQAHAHRVSRESRESRESPERERVSREQTRNFPRGKQRTQRSENDLQKQNKKINPIPRSVHIHSHSEPEVVALSWQTHSSTRVRDTAQSSVEGVSAAASERESSSVSLFGSGEVLVRVSVCE